MSDTHISVLNPDGPIAEVRLDRAAKKNAVTLEMLDALVAAARDLAGRAGVRAVILSGAGGDFSAGLDTSTLMGMAGQIVTLKEEILTPPAGEMANRFQLPSTIWAAVPAPVIAVVEGVCFGAGAQIALGADFRIAAPDARFSIMEAKWGLIPDMGITRVLPSLMPADRAKELIMTARILSGAEAETAGLVTRLADDPQAAARALAEDLAARSPDAVHAAKRLVDGAWGGDAAASLRLEAELQVALIGQPNQVETVMAQMQKRTPVYR